MHIHRAVHADIPDLLRLLVQVCDIHHDLRPDIFKPGGIKYTESDLQDMLSDDNRPIYVAAEADTVLGYCFCMWREYLGSSVFTDRRELYIDDLCIDEACRDRGVATALYRHVCGLAKERGCQFVTLNVWCGNGPAEKFYEKMGMRPRKMTMEMPLEDIKC